jgi:thiol-disulfide isomerase/thioredoxin
LLPEGDTILFNRKLQLDFDDRIYLFYGRDKRGNVIVIVDENNNNIFDDQVYYLSAYEMSDSLISINKNVVLSNIPFIKGDSICKYSFEVKFNFKPLNTVKRLTNNKSLISFEYFDNYFAKSLSDSNYLEVNIRPFLPLPFISPNNCLFYLSSSTEKTPHLRVNSMPYRLGDTVKLSDRQYVLEANQGFFDSITIKEIAGNKLEKGYNVGEIADFGGLTLDNKIISVLDFNGSYTIVDFWGTWCKPCIEQLPNLSQMAKDSKFRNHIKFVSILYDSEARKPLAKKLLKQYDILWPQIFERNEYVSESSLIKSMRVNSFPFYILISPSGKILLRTENLENLKKYIDNIRF